MINEIHHKTEAGKLGKVPRRMRTEFHASWHTEASRQETIFKSYVSSSPEFPAFHWPEDSPIREGWLVALLKREFGKSWRIKTATLTIQEMTDQQKSIQNGKWNAQHSTVKHWIVHYEKDSQSNNYENLFMKIRSQIVVISVYY